MSSCHRHSSIGNRSSYRSIRWLLPSAKPSISLINRGRSLIRIIESPLSSRSSTCQQRYCSRSNRSMHLQAAWIRTMVQQRCVAITSMQWWPSKGPLIARATMATIRVRITISLSLPMPVPTPKWAPTATARLSRGAVLSKVSTSSIHQLSNFWMLRRVWSLQTARNRRKNSSCVRWASRGTCSRWGILRLRSHSRGSQPIRRNIRCLGSLTARK